MSLNLRNVKKKRNRACVNCAMFFNHSHMNMTRPILYK